MYLLKGQFFHIAVIYKLYKKMQHSSLLLENFIKHLIF